MQGSSLFATPTSRTPSPPAPATPPPNPDCVVSSGYCPPPSPSPTFPSMQGIELPSTSCAGATSGVVGGGELTPVKRKKRKHSKSSAVPGETRIKSARCSKKSKKKRRHSSSRQQQQQQQQQEPAHLLSRDEPDLQDEELQTELRSALHAMDPSYAQRFGQEVFSIMDNSMRMRLADITRQYRKKKRKLDEISKHKKKKKCSKQLQQQQQQIQLQLQQQQQPHPVLALQQPTILQPQLTLSSTYSSVLG